MANHGTPMTLNLPLLHVKRILIGDNHAAHQYLPDQRLALLVFCRSTCGLRAYVFRLRRKKALRAVKIDYMKGHQLRVNQIEIWTIIP